MCGWMKHSVLLQLESHVIPEDIGEIFAHVTNYKEMDSVLVPVAV